MLNKTSVSKWQTNGAQAQRITMAAPVTDRTHGNERRQ
jgi:hypothetical protein